MSAPDPVPAAADRATVDLVARGPVPAGPDTVDPVTRASAACAPTAAAAPRAGAAPAHPPSAFDAALAARTVALVDSDGRTAQLAARRWRGPADTDDRWLLDRCHGPTVDLGCGPGRLLTALAQRGVPALGVDLSAVAREQCRRRGVAMVQRDVFAPLPGEGRWRHVLLVDGNIGIGGDPAALLDRAARLLACGGTVLVETDVEPAADWRGSVRVHARGRLGPETPWARVGAAALIALAAPAGLAAGACRGGARAFVELHRR